MRMKHSLGKLLKQKREELGHTQMEISRRMGFTSNGYIATIEKGKYEPNEDTLKKYAKALEISLEQILKLRQKGRLMDMGLREDHIFTEMMRIPLLGEVPCGEPTEAIEDAKEFFPIPFDESLANKKDLFGLKANGLSMKDAGILPGDIMIIDPHAYVNNGDIVVAKINEEATLKFYYERGGYVELRPANPDFKPIKTNDPSFVIVGKVIKKATFEDYD